MSRKDQLRMAAIRVIAREGFFNATTAKIAQEAGVAVGTLYNYYETKEDILEDVFATESQKRIRHYTKIKNSDQEWLVKIEEILRFHFQEMKNEPDVVRVILAERINAGRSQRISLEKFAMLPLILAEIIEQGKRENKVRECDAKMVSVLIFGAIEAVMGEFTSHLNEQFLEKALVEICDLIRDGLVLKKDG